MDFLISGKRNSMKSLLLLFGVLLITSISLFTIGKSNQSRPSIVKNTFIEKEGTKSPLPNDYWIDQRSYPDGFDELGYKQSMELVRLTQLPQTKTLTNPWIQEGPGNIGGRFNALASPSSDPSIIYAGACNGGIFKTEDDGSTWDPIFDDYAYLAIGDIAIDPSNENVLYVGTGDKNFGGGSYLGNGIYKSTDAGDSWSNIGLTNVGIITKVQVDPLNSDRIFASTLGNTFEKTTERGLYRTIDGGATWENILFLSDSSGVADFVLDPSDPNIIYATGFNRINLPFQGKVSGPDAGIYKSIDGGDSWVELTTGLPSTEESRIGLAIAPSTPSTLYAVYVDGTTLDVKDVYKTTDSGSNWSALNVHAGGLEIDAMGGFGWYFGQIHINPFNENQLTIQGVEMFKSEDGGSSWTKNVPDWWTYEVHADKHDILYRSATEYIIATDGGLYKTSNNGVSWSDIENIPVTQFYHITVNPFIDGLYAGGAQDNGSTSGNATSLNSWDRLLGGDGFRVTYDASTPTAVFYETQNGGLYYENSSTGEFEVISPSGIVSDRFNWDMPYVYNENTQELFVGGSSVWKMDAPPYSSYSAISLDLTDAADGDFIGSLSQHTITELALPHNNDDIIYVGTKDGKMWRGERSSGLWDFIDISGGLPNRYVSGIRCSPEQENVVYVTYSGYKYNDFTSYIYKSEDFGETWMDISGDLPTATVNDIAIAPYENDELLFAALDGGVYFSSNSGINWDYVGINLPFATISELAFDIPNKKLIAGTFSRSVWSYDVSWIDGLNQVSSTNNETLEFLQIYPNPASEIITVNTNMNSGNLELYSIRGTLISVSPVSTNSSSIKLDISQLPKGQYILKINNLKQEFIKF